MGRHIVAQLQKGKMAKVQKDKNRTVAKLTLGPYSLKRKEIASVSLVASLV